MSDELKGELTALRGADSSLNRTHLWWILPVTHLAAFGVGYYVGVTVKQADHEDRIRKLEAGLDKALEAL